MTFNDIEYDLTFSPLLKTREQIQATAHFFVGGTGSYATQFWIPFLSLESAEQDIKNILQAEADAVANRWGLQFSSAEAALDHSAYQSLTASLLAIASSEFVVRRVVVRQIIPLSARIPAPPLPPPPPKPKPPEPTRAEREIAALAEDLQMMDMVDAFKKHSQETHPHLWTPVVGQGGFGFKDPAIKRRIDSLLSRILDPEGGR